MGGCFLSPLDQQTLLEDFYRAPVLSQSDHLSELELPWPKYQEIPFHKSKVCKGEFRKDLRTMVELRKSLGVRPAYLC